MLWPFSESGSILDKSVRVVLCMSDISGNSLSDMSLGHLLKLHWIFSGPFPGPPDTLGTCTSAVKLLKDACGNFAICCFWESWGLQLDRLLANRSHAHFPTTRIWHMVGAATLWCLRVEAKFWAFWMKTWPNSNSHDRSPLFAGMIYYTGAESCNAGVAQCTCTRTSCNIRDILRKYKSNITAGFSRWENHWGVVSGADRMFRFQV